MTRTELLHRVAERLGVEPPERCEPLTLAVITSFAERLSRLEANAIADELPAPFADPVRSASHGGSFELAELHARVARRADVRLGIAVEFTATVLEVLGEAIGGDAVRRLERELPGRIHTLLVPVERGTEPPPHLHPERRTLAEGRSGGTRPLYAVRADAAQSESIVRSKNPHEDTKLSSARGLTQEREGETLAAGHPGSDRPLSGPGRE